MGICDRLSEFQKVKSGIVAGRRLEKGRNRSQGFPESRVICGLEIPRGYQHEKEAWDNEPSKITGSSVELGEGPTGDNSEVYNSMPAKEEEGDAQ